MLHWGDGFFGRSRRNNAVFLSQPGRFRNQFIGQAGGFLVFGKEGFDLSLILVDKSFTAYKDTRDHQTAVVEVFPRPR